ncbi:unnamed protein product [Trichobilharzia regenti]|nr:unnamed protein product [Trichobilharzia regenti]
MFRYENPLHTLIDISTNLLSSVDKCKKPTELVPEIDQVNVNTLNDALKKTVKDNQVAFSLVGPNLGSIAPIQVLLKALDRQVQTKLSLCHRLLPRLINTICGREIDNCMEDLIMKINNSLRIAFVISCIVRSLMDSYSPVLSYL